MLPIGALTTRTERAHRTSPGGVGRSVQIGTSVLVLRDTDRRLWRVSCRPAARRSVRLGNHDRANRNRRSGAGPPSAGDGAEEGPDLGVQAVACFEVDHVADSRDKDELRVAKSGMQGVPDVSGRPNVVFAVDQKRRHVNVGKYATKIGGGERPNGSLGGDGV
jgi:hypothetical protein